MPLRHHKNHSTISKVVLETGFDPNLSPGRSFAGLYFLRLLKLLGNKKEYNNIAVTIEYAFVGSSEQPK